MNNCLQADRKLLFKHEALRSRLDIRDFFLKNTVREVYENIGQVLSVVRMQLAVLGSDYPKDTDGSIHSPGHLVGQSIRDLRALSKSFYPDADILKDEGFIEAFENTIEILYQNTNPVIKIKGERKDIQPELKLIIFKMMQEILISVKEAEGEFISLVISYAKEEVKFIVSYNGKMIALNEEITSNGADPDLTLQQRAQLIEGRFNVTKSKDGITRIKLISSLNCLFYE